MISSFIITFRETLEAALIVGIILAYLVQTKRTKYNNIVYIGIAAGIIASILGAFIFNYFAGGFTGRAEEIFEGIAMLFAAFLITFMILWMMKQKHIVMEIHKKVDTEIKEEHKVGLFLLVFISTLREGIETVIFLGAASFVEKSGYNVIGALSGIIAAVILGYFIFVASKKINIKKFFNITSILLILFAAGLTAHGIHELEEAKLVNPIIEHVWDINPPTNPDGTYPALHENGFIGSILKGLFGYNGNPSLMELIGYLSYILLAFILWRNIEKIHKVI